MDTEEAYANKGYMSIHEADVEEGRKEEREKIAAEMAAKDASIAAKDAEIQRLSELLASKG